ncbi:MAG: SRPBCC family protein [Ilumatobacteraceae bacterium]
MSFSVSRSAVIEAPLSQVVGALRDLSTYSEWVPIVSRVEPDGDEHWFVELGVAIGPFARSKRLRMKRSINNFDRVGFVRDESDGRSHAGWELNLTLKSVDAQTSVHAVLDYDGKMWTPGPVEEALHSGLDSAIDRLQTFVDAQH